MDYAEVERSSDAYKEQALLQTMEEQALEDYLELMPVLSYHSKDGVVSPEAARDAIPYHAPRCRPPQTACSPLVAEPSARTKLHSNNSLGPSALNRRP